MLLFDQAISARESHDRAKLAEILSGVTADYYTRLDS